MHIGVCMFATDYAIRIDELAREAEARGFESLFVPEHTHIPVSRRTPFPSGGPIPKEYSHTFDPFVSLMAAAGSVKVLAFGPGTGTPFVHQMYCRGRVPLACILTLIGSPTKTVSPWG